MPATPISRPKPEPRRDHDAKKDNGPTDHQDGQRVSEAPQRADGGRAPQPSLAADDGGHRDDVIGVGGVAHPEEDAERQERRQARWSRLLRQREPHRDDDQAGDRDAAARAGSKVQRRTASSAARSSSGCPQLRLREMAAGVPSA